MTESSGSVLCVVHEANIHSPALAAAQRAALHNNAPMAVVVVLPDAAEISTELMMFEKQLSAYSLPLLVLVGEEETRLQGAIYHLKPLMVFTDYATYMQPGEPLQLHPHAWPGLVVPLVKLPAYVAGSAC